MAKHDKAKELIGARMQALRKMKGLTQEELAEKVGLSDKYLSSVECGKENPTLETLLKLAEAVGVPIGEFFSIEEAAWTPAERVRAAASLLKKASPQQVAVMIRMLRELGVKK